jgi:hypothetical protein
MERAPYYVIQRLEVVGGSTGWYRARLIDAALEHIDEWWIGGTDYTRHWVYGGFAITEDHIDFTNHYLILGVTGGLPLMLLHIAIITVGFSFVGRGLVNGKTRTAQQRFTLWTLGSSLLAHVVTNISVSYFDQSFLFFYFTLAAIACAHSADQPLDSAQRPHGVAAAVPRFAGRSGRLRARGHPPGRPPAPAVRMHRTQIWVHSQLVHQK